MPEIEHNNDGGVIYDLPLFLARHRNCEGRHCSTNGKSVIEMNAIMG